MKRITKGNPHAIWWLGKQGTCDLCGEVIEFERHDNPRLWHSRALCTDNAVLPCPTCDTDITVYTSTSASDTDEARAVFARIEEQARSKA